jgi:HmuY protein
MNRSSAIFVCLAGLLSFGAVVACSDDDETTNVAPGADAATGDTSTPDSGSPQEEQEGGSCSAALQTALLPVEKVSNGEVTVLKTEGTTKTLFVDASAGGAAQAATEPRVYLDLTNTSRVDISDVAAATSTNWDLALERSYLFTNGGQGGPGQGGAVFLEGKDESAVTTADAAGITAEKFVDDTCTAIPDRSGRGVKTTFDDWYDYNQSNNLLTPADGTYLVRGATGKLFKVRILEYYATPDGGKGEAGGRFTLRVTPLE